MCGKCSSPIEKSFHEYWAKSNLSKRFTLVPQYVIGKHRADFLVQEMKTLIEIDSKQYHSSPEAQKNDKEREGILRKEGWHVIRIYGPDVFHHPSETIKLVEFAMQHYYAGRVFYEDRSKFELIFNAAKKILPNVPSEKKEAKEEIGEKSEQEKLNAKLNGGCFILANILSILLPIVASIIELCFVDSGNIVITKDLVQSITVGTILLAAGPLVLCLMAIWRGVIE